MKKYLLLVIILLGFAPHAFAACGNGYSFCRTVVADHTKAGATDISNYAMLFSTTTLSSLAVVGSGGKVQNTTTQTGGGASITVPADLVFTSDAACTTKLPFEWETYNSATGATIVWVNIGTLSHTVDTTVYLCYGNSSVTTYQGNVNSTWDSNYVTVWHLPNGSTLSGAESTSNAYTLANTSATAVTGQVDGGAGFNGSTSGLATGSSANLNILGTSGFTYSVWVFPTSNTMTGGYGTLYFRDDFSDWIIINNNGNIFVQVGGSAGNDFTMSTHWTVNAWNNIVVTAPGSGGSGTVYLNGQSVSTITTGSTNGGGSTSSLGMTSGNYILQGTLDESRVSKTNRSASSVLADYNNQNSPNTFYTVGAEQSGGVTAVLYRFILTARMILSGRLIIN